MVKKNRSNKPVATERQHDVGPSQESFDALKKLVEDMNGGINRIEVTQEDFETLVSDVQTLNDALVKAEDDLATRNELITKLEATLAETNNEVGRLQKAVEDQESNVTENAEFSNIDPQITFQNCLRTAIQASIDPTTVNTLLTHPKLMDDRATLICDLAEKIHTTLCNRYKIGK